MRPLIEVAGPLVAAVIYSLSTFLLRSATLNGVSYRSQLVWTALGIGITGIPPLIIAGPPLPGTWMPAILGGLGIGLGQFLTVLSLTKGDASVQTPLMGTKVIWVVLIGWLGFGISAPPSTWIAAVLAAAAVIVIGFTRASRAHASLPAIGAALASAVSFAFFDSIVASGRYGGLVSGFFGLSIIVAGASTAAVALAAFPRPAAPDRRGASLLAVASFLIFVQFAIQVGVVAWFGRAAEANVLYSSRGLWSVVFAWILVRRDDDLRPPPGVYLQRLLGAGLLVAAVVLVI